MMLIRNLFFVILIFSFLSCASNLRDVSNNHRMVVETNQVDYVVYNKEEAEKQKICQYVNLKVILKSELKENLMFDKKAFFSAINETDQLYLNKQVENLEESTILIEDKRGNFKFIGERRENKERPYRLDYLEEGCVLSCKSIIESNSKKEVVVFEDIEVCIDDLKIADNIGKIRLYYIYVPTSQEEKNGFKRKIIKSNWFVLKSDT
jgi:hypothetical protein